jgi:preprotein translocase subunit SecA
MKIFSKIFGDANEKIIKEIRSSVEEINDLEAKFGKMSDEELRNMTLEFKKRLGTDKNPRLLSDKDFRKELDACLPEAFAVIREAAKRVIGQRHYDVQLIGGVVLHRGQIAEMKTGEGKTLVATLPLYLNALSGEGAHLITVNDYLSRVGAGWMAPVFYFLGLSVSVIVHDSAFIYDPEYSDDSQFDERLKNFRKIERKEAYACDITYGTNNEFGFDYLRDNMAPNLERMVQRSLNFAIVDEVDSILIDEARTPLIISAPAEESTDKYFKFAGLVTRLKENVDYNVDEKMRAATLSEAGISKMETWLGVENIYVSGGVREVHHIEQALKAHVLFKRDRDYVVKDGEIIIVDEFTGRLMPGRRYSEGLHQAIEAKENVKVQRESQTLASITFQNYFRMYNKLSGMTGTAVTEAEEFSKIYNLETIVIPTNKPNQRKDYNDLIFRTELGKFKAVAKDVKERNKKGQPVLIGTISIEKNELLAGLMEKEGLKPHVLNAKNHLKEARIIAEAGKPGAITIATNMAGRGVDIILGGSSENNKEEKEKVKKLGGLHIIGTERHEARRIDNQLRGRAGRQGDPGSSQFYISADDDLMRIFGGERMKKIMTTLNLPEDMPIDNKIVSRSIESAQKKVEGNNFDMRKHLVEYDDVINKHRESIYKKRKEVLELHKKQTEKDFESEKNKDETEDLNERSLSGIIFEMLEGEIERVVSFHTSGEDIKEWNIEEIYQVATTIFPVKEKLKEALKDLAGDNGKLDKAIVRTKIIEHLIKEAKENYSKIKDGFIEAGLRWEDVEKGILIRSIDTLWIEHLDAMQEMRRGIGLRGYGQRDPLVEYKKEAYMLYNELKALIEKQVVYSIFKVADVGEFKAPDLSQRAKNFSAPAKTMESGSSSFGFESGDKGAGGSSGDFVKQVPRNEEGEKIGRNDPCPCGSGKKYKKCHGR